MTILGTRPEIIRLSRVISKLDRLCDHFLVHTGQNSTAQLSDVFFAELRVRAPNAFLGISTASFGRQVADLFPAVETLLLQERPDFVLILGDTNSGLSALVAKRLGIRVYHMEAGNRCFDDRVPEEVNRRAIDHASDVLMPYTERSRQHLLREGIPGQRVIVTGNPILEVLRYYEPEIGRSDVMARLQLTPKAFFLVTLHRAENVDVDWRLRNLIEALRRLHAEYGHPVIVSTHPRTRAMMERHGVSVEPRGVSFLEPLGFFDFVHLERQAACVITDSGTVQEETAIFGVPNITARDVTERPETIECGSNILAGCDVEAILRTTRVALSRQGRWTTPAEYLVENVSDTVINVLLGQALPIAGPR